MNRTLIKNATLVNEYRVFESDVLVAGERIEKIAPNIAPKNSDTIIEANGMYLLPGVIDDQVHFREPGLTHKATIASESRAAIAGGITSFIEQPNTQPSATNLQALEEKFAIAGRTSYANYSFMLGGANNNLEEIKRLDKNACAGIKVFLGSSTGSMLVDDEQALENIFRNTNLIISAHCEDETTIKTNLETYQSLYGDAIPMRFHPLIRSEEACYRSSFRAIALAKKTGARLHVFHVSTAKETSLFRNDIPLEKKQITAEVCLHHLWFTDADYAEKGTLIKWNPAIKTARDREALWSALLDNRIDVIATDHAPHTWAEKQLPYTQAPSGAPMVQHALVAMLEMVQQKKISIEKMVEKMCHNPALLFQVAERGFLREGYYADMVLIDPGSPWTVSKENLRYQCGWSPMEGISFTSEITHTFVNGNLAYCRGQISENRQVKRLTFTR